MREVLIVLNLLQVWHSILSSNISFDVVELESVSAAARDLLEGLLERDPDDRLTPKQALIHPWIKVKLHTHSMFCELTYFTQIC